MSVKVSSWVWHGEETAEVAGNEMILLLALADVADDNGRCRFMTDDDDLTYAGLAKKARVDRSTAIRVVARLRKRGLIEQEKGSRTRPNEFAIAVPWRKGGDLPPVPKVASETRKVASETTKGGIRDDHPSYRRIDVDVTPVVPFGDSVEEKLEAIWNLWPSARRSTRKVVERSIRSALKVADWLTIFSAAERHTEVWATWPASDEKFIPLLSTWLNQERWTGAPPQPRGSGRLSAVDTGRAADAILAGEPPRLRAL